MILQPVPMMVKKEIVPEPDQFGNCSLYLPETSRILNFGMVNDQMCFWYLKRILPKDKIEKQLMRHFKIVNTNVEFDNSEYYLYKGSVKTSNGVMWHCFVDASPYQKYDQQ